LCERRTLRRIALALLPKGEEGRLPDELAVVVEDAVELELQWPR
jgi:hypothetical protein